MRRSTSTHCICASLTLPLLPTGTTSYIGNINVSIREREYEQRVREVEHVFFTPPVLAETGGMTNETAFFYKTLALLLARKWDLLHRFTCVGYVVFCCFPCYNQPFNASREFGPLVAMLVSHHLQLTCS